MRKLIAFLLLSACAFAQGIGGTAGAGGSAGFGGGATASGGTVPTGASHFIAWFTGNNCSAHNPCLNGDNLDQPADQSGNANNLTVRDFAAVFNTNLFGTTSGATFNRALPSDYNLTTGLQPASGTYCAVIKPTQPAGTSGTIFGGAAGSLQLRTVQNGKESEVLKTGVASLGTSTSAYSTAAHLVCATYDGTNLAFFLDGVADGTATTTPPNGTIADTTLRIGFNPANGGEEYSGTMCLEGIWPRIFTAGDHTNLHGYAQANCGTP